MDAGSSSGAGPGRSQKLNQTPAGYKGIRCRLFAR